MSIRHMSAVWDDPYYDQGDKAKLLVALAIADFANAEGVAFPSIESIAKKARTRPRGVQEICRELEKDGKLDILAGKGRNGTNLYRLKGVRLEHPTPSTSRVEGCGSRRGADSAGCDLAAEKAAKILPEKAALERTQSVRNHQEPPESVKNPSTPKTAVEVTERGLKFAEFFRKLLPADMRLESAWQRNWAKCFDDLTRIDERSPEEIKAVCEWARKDEFWQSNFLSPLKLRQKNPSGANYFDVFMAKMKPQTAKATLHTEKSKYGF